MAKKRKPNKYALFIKKNFRTVTGTAPQRMKKLAKQWRAMK